MELDVDPGSQDIEGTSYSTHNNGSPRVDGGASGSDGHQSSQGTIAHHTDIVCHATCTFQTFIGKVWGGINLVRRSLV